MLDGVLTGSQTFAQCNELLMNVYQVAVMPVGTTIFVGLALVFFDRFPKGELERESDEFAEYFKAAKRQAYLLMGTFLIILSIDLVICVILVSNLALFVQSYDLAILCLALVMSTAGQVF